MAETMEQLFMHLFGQECDVGADRFVHEWVLVWLIEFGLLYPQAKAEVCTQKYMTKW